MHSHILAWKNITERSVEPPQERHIVVWTDQSCTQRLSGSRLQVLEVGVSTERVRVEPPVPPVKQPTSPAKHGGSLKNSR